MLMRRHEPSGWTWDGDPPPNATREGGRQVSLCPGEMRSSPARVQQAESPRTGRQTAGLRARGSLARPRDPSTPAPPGEAAAGGLGDHAGLQASCWSLSPRARITGPVRGDTGINASGLLLSQRTRLGVGAEGDRATEQRQVEEDGHQNKAEEKENAKGDVKSGGLWLHVTDREA